MRKIAHEGDLHFECGLPSGKDHFLACIDGIDLVAVPELGTSGDDPFSLLGGKETAHVSTRQDLEIRTIEGGEEVCLHYDYESVQYAGEKIKTYRSCCAAGTRAGIDVRRTLEGARVLYRGHDERKALSSSFMTTRTAPPSCSRHKEVSAMTTAIMLSYDIPHHRGC